MSRDHPHSEARGLLIEWGGPYEAMQHGSVGAESDQQLLGTRIDKGGQHSNPTQRNAESRERWLEIDAAVRELPPHWWHKLYQKFVRGLSDRQAADKDGKDRKAWVAERDAAMMLFLGRYQERRRLRRGTLSGDRPAPEPQDVA